MSDLRTTRVELPEWMLEELRGIAESRGVTVVEHIRRCVSLERTLFEDTEAVVTVRGRNGVERTIRLAGEST